MERQLAAQPMMIRFSSRIRITGEGSKGLEMACIARSVPGSTATSIKSDNRPTRNRSQIAPDKAGAVVEIAARGRGNILAAVFPSRPRYVKDDVERMVA